MIENECKTPIGRQKGLKEEFSLGKMRPNFECMFTGYFSWILLVLSQLLFPNTVHNGCFLFHMRRIVISFSFFCRSRPAISLSLLFFPALKIAKTQLRPFYFPSISMSRQLTHMLPSSPITCLPLTPSKIHHCVILVKTLAAKRDQ